MRAFVAFLKKEWLECVRSGKLLFLSLLFLLFGIMNPAVAKLTPWLLEFMAESMAESGMTVTAVEVNALTSWTQFFKNIPMALIAFVLLCGGIFTKEYSQGTLVLILTKGVSRVQVLLAKTLLLFSLWTVGYYACFAVTYGYNAYFWDNGIANRLLEAVFYWWLFGVFVVCLLIFFSSIFKDAGGVMLGTGGIVMACYLLGALPKIGSYLPTALTNSGALLAGGTEADLWKAALVCGALSLLCVASSVPILNRKQL